MSKGKRPSNIDNDINDLEDDDTILDSFTSSPLLTDTAPIPHSAAPLSPLGGYVLDKCRMKDSLNRYRIQSLFEGMGTSTDEPVFTLNDYSESKYPSFKRMYVEIGDPSEYEMAIRLLGSWEHWTRLMESNWFKPYLNEAREELNAKIRSMAVAKIQADGKGAFSEATRLAANKFLATGGYLQEAEKEVVKESAKRGRPSKEEIARRTKEILTEEGTLNKDYERMMALRAPVDA